MKFRTNKVAALLLGARERHAVGEQLRRFGCKRGGRYGVPNQHGGHRRDHPGVYLNRDGFDEPGFHLDLYLCLHARGHSRDSQPGSNYGGELHVWADGEWRQHRHVDNRPASADNTLSYSAPALSNFPNPIPTITFTAAAAANTNKKGTVTVGLDTGIRVSVTPATATMPVGLNPAQEVQFTASFLNVSPANVSPKWAVMQPVAGVEHHDL